MEEENSPRKISLEEKLEMIVHGTRPEGDQFFAINGVVYSGRGDWLELHEAREPHDD